MDTKMNRSTEAKILRAEVNRLWEENAELQATVFTGQPPWVDYFGMSVTLPIIKQELQVTIKPKSGPERFMTIELLDDGETLITAHGTEPAKTRFAYKGEATPEPEFIVGATLAKQVASEIKAREVQRMTSPFVPLDTSGLCHGETARLQLKVDSLLAENAKQATEIHEHVEAAMALRAENAKLRKDNRPWVKLQAAEQEAKRLRIANGLLRTELTAAETERTMEFSDSETAQMVVKMSEESIRRGSEILDLKKEINVLRMALVAKDSD